MKKKYETFYTCPGCGQLVPKDTTVCDCGYIFEDVYKVSVFKVIFEAILFYFLISLLYSLSYGILDLLVNLVRRISFVSVIFDLPIIGLIIEGGIFISAIFALFSASTTSTILLFGKIDKRYLQSSKAILGGSILCFISFLFNLVWNILYSGGFIHYYILALIQSAFVLHTTHKIHADADSERLSANPTPSIPQDDYEEKKRYAQMRVDAFYAEIFAGQVSPYTGLPVKSEKDYLKHLSSKRQSDAVASNGNTCNTQSSMGRSFSELVRDEKLEQAKINAMTKEAYAQYRVDKVCADLFKGQVNPYSQKPIVCEADFREYQRQHNS